MNMKLKALTLTTLAAITVCMHGTANAVSLQQQIEDLQDQIDNIQLTPGPQGPTGATGPQGPAGSSGSQFVLAPLAPDGVPTNGKVHGAEWHQCQTELGGRPANSKDVLTLPWDPSLEIEAMGGWVNPYIVSSGGNVSGGEVVDASGRVGLYEFFTCGVGGASWFSTFDERTGLVAQRGNVRFAECDNLNNIVCVVPASP